VEAVDVAGVDDPDDVVVRELGGDLGLLDEPPDELLVVDQVLQQDLTATIRSTLVCLAL
jgi:hypothetical protein